MAKPNNTSPQQKKGLHPRNPHRARYDFPALVKSTPELSAFVKKNPFGELSVNFSDPDAVKTLNKALLNHFYQISFWDIPKGYLCPPIPGRADYLHYIADLLADTRNGKIPKGKTIKGLDIGMGANCVYPMVGHRAYGWQFVGADIDPVSVKSAKLLVEANPSLKGGVQCRLQSNPDHIFTGMINAKERFDFTLCNPPFHTSMEEATRGSERKVRNLAANARKKGADTRASHAMSHAGANKSLNKAISKATGKETVKPVLNFGGQNAELWCPGGEAAFIKRMIEQSTDFKTQCLWFTTMVSKKENLTAIKQTLKTMKAKDVRTIEMAQGQKVTRIVAWTFLDKDAKAEWCNEW